MSSAGVAMGGQWVQGVMNGPGPCGTVNIWAQRRANSGARHFSGVMRGSRAISRYLSSPRGVRGRAGAAAAAWVCEMTKCRAGS